ncbi:unnamed protein product [Rhizophagus irregularis]|nr:unnamed protein product [Rhizophagus irregularis]
MTSKKYVDIDWSSVSQHSFPQLGNPTPNNDNSDTSFTVTDNPEVLSFEDIFFLDIDDIYPFTYSTLHYEEPKLDDTYEINKYYDNLLKEALAAPIITVQVLPHHSPKPLTPIDTDVTPPPLTNKIFPRVDTADFENINLGYDDKNDFSNLPLISPIHLQVSIENNAPIKDEIPSSVTVLPPKNPLSRPGSAVNNSLPFESDSKSVDNTKVTHVNLIYERWKSGTKKTVTSNRLGISYQEQIHARDVASVLEYGNKHMYRKRLSNFHLLQSKHAGVKKKQEMRFLRACRRVFKTKDIPPDPHRHRLRAAHRYRFLFLKSQYVNKLVKHLIYNHGLVSDDYGFCTPHYYTTLNHVPSRVDGRPIAKSSREWFTYMSALHRTNPNATSRQQQRQNLQQKEEHHRREEEIFQQERNNALLHGTSTHTLPRRKRIIALLTGKSNHFHRKMTEIAERLHGTVDDTLNAQIRKEMDSFENFFTRIMRDGTILNTRQMAALPDDSDETSDDMKTLERRPKKRNDASSTNNLFYRNKDRYKRNRPSEVPIDSTAVAGPSRI